MSSSLRQSACSSSLIIDSIKTFRLCTGNSCCRLSVFLLLPVIPLSPFKLLFAIFCTISLPQNICFGKSLIILISISPILHSSLQWIYGGRGKSSSAETPSTCANRIAMYTFGVLPSSIDVIVDRGTPLLVESCICVTPFCFRILRKLFSISTPSFLG